MYNMVFIGIDFSLNSPGMCIQKNDQYYFVSFFNIGEKSFSDIKIPKAFQYHKELDDLNFINSLPYNRITNSKEFLYKEREKLIDAEKIALLIITEIKRHIEDLGFTEIKIALEGFSYGSSGNSFIDIIQYNTFLRKMLVDNFGIDNIFIVQPTHVKKLAGKGNANKFYMLDAFKKNVFNDHMLAKSNFWKWVKEKDMSLKIPKPIDDLIDSYFILNTIKNLI